MPLQLVTPPSEEPVSLWEAKLHLRVDFDEDDMLIASLITAARQAAETLTGRQFTTARWKQVLDCFPGPSLMGVPAGQAFSLPGHAILLFKTPVQSVVSINYLDMANFTSDHPEILFLRAVDKRYTTAFRYGQLNSPFEYEKVRYVYTQARKLQIAE